MPRTLLGVGLALTFAFAPSPAAAQAAAPTAPDGGALYRQNCRACHGLKGVTPQRMIAVYSSLPKSIGDSAFLRVRSVDSIAAVIRHGVGRNMSGFTSRLTPEEIVAIAKFVKALPSDTTRAP